VPVYYYKSGSPTKMEDINLTPNEGDSIPGHNYRTYLANILVYGDKNSLKSLKTARKVGYLQYEK